MNVNPYEEDEQTCGVHDVVGRAIEQHPLITGYLWWRLRTGMMRQWSYRTIIGSYTNSMRTNNKYTVTREDAP